MAVTAQVNVKIDSTQASKSVGELNSQINKATGSFSSMKAELRSITQELQGLQAGSARFQELSQRAGVLRDTIADTGAVISATAGNAVENFGRAIGNSIQIGVAGFQALQSAQVLFGVENEDLQKTLVQMSALLNLSQAIETFGGLGDKLVEIKAGFTPVLQQLGLMAATQTEVAVATGAADAALVGEAVAADGAAVSTGFFATALNALPLVAIVTALGLLVAGLISYASASGDAEKNEKKRAASLKAQREEEKKATETIAQESAEYVGLIYQLKATNAGSKERETLIKQINSTYNTTLKNLSDEAAFQKQLNLEVANYIVYQKAKFQLQKNEELVQKNLEKQATLQKQLAEAERLYNNELNVKLGQDDLRAGQREQNLRDYSAQISRLKSDIDAANKRLEAYGKVNLDVNAVITEVTGGTNKYTQSTNNNTDAKDKNVDATDAQITAEKSLEAQLDAVNEQYTDTLKFIEDLVNISEIKTPTPQIIQDIQKVVEARKALEERTLADVFKELSIDVSIANGEFGIFEDALGKTADAFGQFYESNRKALSDGSVTQSVTDFGKTINLVLDEASQKLNETVITKEAFDALVGITEQYKNFNKLINLTPDIFSAETLKPFFDATEKLLIAQDVINFEKAQGNLVKVNEEGIILSQAAKEQADALIALQQELTKYYTEQFNFKSKTFETDIKNANLTAEQEKKLLDARKEGADKQKEIIGEIVKTQIDGVKNIVETVTEEESAIRNFLAESNKLKSDNLKDLDDLVKKALLNNTDLLIKETQKSNAIVLDANKSAKDNLFSFEEQMSKKFIDLTKFTEEEKLKLVQEYLDAQGETETDKLQSRLDTLDDYLASVQALYSDFESALTNLTEQNNERRTQAIQDGVNAQTQILDANLAARLITQQEYDNQVLQLQQEQEQQERALAKKSFETNKKLSLVGATIDGARAVLATFASTPGELIIKSIAAALAGVFAATQVAIIARSQFTAADGGIVPGTNSGDIDSVSATLAPGEAVINSKSTSKFLPVLSAINQDGGGRSLMPNLPATNQGQKFEVVFPENKQMQPVRAYVVESDISDAQKRVQRIENSTRF